MFFLMTILAGLVLGSFSTALIYRVPRGIAWSSLNNWRSECTSCRHVLGWRDLIPLYSWASARGRCRHCKADIGRMYIGAEIAVLVLCIMAYLVHGPSMETVFIILAVPFLVALTVIDLEHMILPNELIAILAILGLGRAVERSLYFQDVMPFYMAVVAAAVFALLVWALGVLMTRLLRRDALGLGDVKFFAIAGLWLGLENLAFFCLAAGFIGIVFSLFWRHKKKPGVFPFGPALIASFYLILIIENYSFL